MCDVAVVYQLHQQPIMLRHLLSASQSEAQFRPTWPSHVTTYDLEWPWRNNLAQYRLTWYIIHAAFIRSQLSPLASDYIRCKLQLYAVEYVQHLPSPRSDNPSSYRFISATALSCQSPPSCGHPGVRTPTFWPL